MFKETTEGLLIFVKVTPNARKNELQGIVNGTLKIKIAAQPEDGKANEELIRFLAKELDLSKSQISVVKGHASRDKTLLLRGISRELFKNSPYADFPRS